MVSSSIWVMFSLCTWLLPSCSAPMVTLRYHCLLVPHWAASDPTLLMTGKFGVTMFHFLCVRLPSCCRGKVSDAVVMDRKGYGFVTFADPKAAMKFLEVCAAHAAGAEQQRVQLLGARASAASAGTKALQEPIAHAAGRPQQSKLGCCRGQLVAAVIQALPGNGWAVSACSSE